LCDCPWTTTAVNLKAKRKYATVYPANLTALIAGEGDEPIQASDADKFWKCPRRVKRNRAIYKLRRNFPRLLMAPAPVMRVATLDRFVVPFRSPPHKTPRTKRFL
jgi:hypothetical protein